ncbi:MAG: hypothetical protein JXA18_15045 [Chitinispirillaceae bacterium]|nr:hypothetical protein [Chitinispirillaceae bacterium]
MRKITIMILTIGLCCVAAFAQQSAEITGWEMQDSSKVASATGETISSPSYTAAEWYKATVPGTVLGTLVDQGVYNDPMVGQQMYDIPDLAKEQRRYWFRAKFNATFAEGQRVWIEFGGINYFATVYCNGQQVGTMYGAFKEAKFDVTDKAVSGENVVAVKIRGNYYPGDLHKQRLTGNCGPNGGVMSRDGPTFIASQGWDWIPTIPDRDMGIWKPVYVRVTGPVVIRHPWIKTTDVSTASATVPLQVTLRNSTAAAVSGTLDAGIDNNALKFESKTVTVPANDTLNVSFTSLTMTNPRLWWPNGYGEPNLYDCRISFTPDGGTVSDSVQFNFGVRQFTFQDVSSGLIISCNGQRILARGGNWGMDDAMKKWDLHKLETQVRYHKEMNFNMIRDWLGGTDRDPFYDYCDRYGLMVWSDFWEPHSADQPNPVDDQANFIANMRDKIYRTRNRACVAIWCARNETAPTTAFLTALKNFHTELDGTRIVLASSGSGSVHSGGPYTYTSPANIYSVLTGFHTELGGQCIPSYESVTAMGLKWPIDQTSWSFHDFCVLNARPTDYTNVMTTLYGTPDNLKDCCTRAQLINYDAWRAYLEGLQAKRFNGATGLLIWMSNCVWPSLVWQTYDYYLEGTGAMYGAQKGSEPVHIMYYGSGSYNVSVVNNTPRAISDYSATGTTYNLDGSQVWTKTAAVSVAADAANTNALGAAITKGTSTPYFLDLKLKDGSGGLVSKNFYWLPNSGSDISNMLKMTKAALAMTTSEAEWSREGVENTISFKIANTASVCAIACRLKLTRQSGERILPCHYNDNYFSFAPGDTQEVVIRFDEVDRKSEVPKLVVSGINVDEKPLAVPAEAKTRVFNGTTSRTMPKATMRLAAGKIHLNNLGTASPWSLALFDLRGRVVAAARGVGTGGSQTVSLDRLRPGIYVATLRCIGAMQKSIVTVAR